MFRKKMVLSTVDRDVNNEIKRMNKLNKFGAIVVGALSFTILIALVLYNAEYNENTKNFADKKRNSKQYIRFITVKSSIQEQTLIIVGKNSTIRTYNDKYCQKPKACSILCANTFVDYVNNFIETETNDCKSINDLELIRIEFPDNIMSKNWYTASKSITNELKLNMLNIIDIKDDAFNAEQFQDTKILTFSETKIKYFYKNMFRGLKYVQHFNIRQNSQTRISYEAGFLEEFKNGLEVLQIVYGINDPEAIFNITGIIKLSNLKEIDFRFNSFTYLSAEVFNTPLLTKLSLEQCKLQYLDDNVFKFISALEFLNIESNNLLTLSPKDLQSLRTLHIRYNNWNCNCELCWLKKPIVQNKENVFCSDGRTLPIFLEQNCSNEDTCLDLTTTTESSSSKSTTTTISTSLSTTVTTITMTTEASTTEQSTKKPLTTETSTTKTTREEPQTSYTDYPNRNNSTCFSPNDIDIPIDENENGIKIDGNFNHYSVFTTNIENDEICLVKPNIRNIPMKPNTAYSVCKIDNYPIMCISGRILPTIEDRPWIENKHKVVIFSVGAIIFILIILITAVLIFLFIRQHPKLLKGNKRIVIVRSPKTDVLVMPTKPQSPIYIATRRRELSNPTPVFIENMQQQSPIYIETSRPEYSVTTIPNAFPQCRRNTYRPVQEAIYLSPKSERYIYAQQGPRLVRSLSDLSLQTVASYMTENQMSFTQSSQRFQKVSSEEHAPVPPPRKINKNRLNNVLAESKSYDLGGPS